MVYDRAGQPVTMTFADYLLPTATEIPAVGALAVVPTHLVPVAGVALVAGSKTGVGKGRTRDEQGLARRVVCDPKRTRRS